jgi:hypothetical protein
MRDRPRALAGYADVASLEVRERDIHHRRHQRVGEGVVLVEGRQAEIGEDGGETEIDLQAGRRAAVFALVIQPRDLDPAVRQLDSNEPPHMLVDHRHVEFEVVADQRT